MQCVAQAPRRPGQAGSCGRSLPRPRRPPPAWPVRSPRPAAADPEGTARCGWVLWLLPRALRQRGARPKGTRGYSRVLEGARGRRASLFETRLGSTRTHTHSLCRCVHMRIRRTRGVHVLCSAAAAWRAGKYTWGAAGKVICPAGTARIDDLTACQAAATAAGKTPPSSSENSDLSPKGCYSSTRSPGVSFNAHVTGQERAADDETLLLCAGAGVCARFTHPPAPPTAYPHVHLWMPSLYILYKTSPLLWYSRVVLAAVCASCPPWVDRFGMAATATATPTTYAPTLLPSPSPATAPAPPPSAGMRTGWA